MNICVSFGNCSKFELLEKLTEASLAEIRLDLLDWVLLDDTKEIFSKHSNSIATFRPGKIEDQKRMEYLTTAIKSGAAYVDIETESDPEFISQVIETARKHNTKVIISYHNYEVTPSLKTLQGIVVDALKKNADIVKVACQVNSQRDCARLLSLLDGKRTVVPIGLGKIGTITRVAALNLGAPFTYAGFELDHKVLERLISEISDV